jgi:hypothetical protein
MSSSLAAAAAGCHAAVPAPTALRRSRARRSHISRASAASSASSASASAASSNTAKLLKKAADAIAEDLKGVSITFVGDNEAANVLVAKAMAKALGYTPLSTPELIERVTDSTREEIVAEDGEGGLVIAENAVLEQLSTFIRWGCTS